MRGAGRRDTAGRTVAVALAVGLSVVLGVGAARGHAPRASAGRGPRVSAPAAATAAYGEPAVPFGVGAEQPLPTALPALEDRWGAGGAAQAAVDAAVAYAETRGWRTGIAVVDLRTRRVLRGGDVVGTYPAESTVKVLLAADLLAAGKMNGAVAEEATAMVTASDDEAADDLYDLTAGDGLVAWAQTRYGIEGLGTGPVNGPGEWGSTQVSPLGMARFLAAAHADPAVGPWLTGAMASMREVAADGTDQMFGLRAADPTAAVKQGWGGDVPGLDAEGTPSIGYVDGGRYAVALYTLHVPATSQEEAQAMVTEQARLLLPGGHLPA